MSIQGGNGITQIPTGRGAKIYGNVQLNGTGGTLSITGASTSNDADNGAWIGGDVTRNTANTASFTFANPSGSVYGPRVEGKVDLKTASGLTFGGKDTYIGGENGTITVSGQSVYVRDNPVILSKVQLTANSNATNTVVVNDEYSGYLAKLEPASKNSGDTVVTISGTATQKGVKAINILDGFDYYDQSSSLGIVYVTPISSKLVLGSKMMSVKLNYNYPDGTQKQLAKKVSRGELFTEYDIPEFEGYSFAGWYTKAQGGDLFNELNTAVISDIELYAHWNQIDKSQSYTVTVYAHEALEGFEELFPADVQTYTVYGGATVPLGNASEYYGHKFEGWYTDKALNNEWNIHNTVTEDMELYGKWSTRLYVTYAKVSGKNSDENVVTVESIHNPNNIIYMPIPIDTKLNRNSLHITVSEESELQKGMNLTAGNFFSSETSDTSTDLQLQADNSMITSNAKFPMKSDDGGKTWIPRNTSDDYIDYNIIGLRTMAKNANIGNISDFSMADKTIYGKTSGNYNVKYTMTGVFLGTDLVLMFIPDNLKDTYKVKYNALGKDKYTLNLYRDSFAIDYTPNYYGYDFLDWYKDPGFSEPWDFDTDLITKDTTLYAKLEKNELLEGVDPFDYDTSDEWIIKSKDEFLMFASMVTAEGYTFEDKRVILDTDIDFNNTTIMPIGDANTNFKGTFDGQNHTISNYKLEYMGSGVGLFGNINGALICNVKIKNVTVYGSEGVTDGIAALVGYDISSRIINCHVDGFTTGSSSRYMGGIVGSSYGTEITACSIDNAQIQFDQSHAGGIVGSYASNNGVVKDCYVGSNVSVSRASGIVSYNYALIVGINNGSTVNCFVNQNSTSYVGDGTWGGQVQTV